MGVFLILSDTAQEHEEAAVTTTVPSLVQIGAREDDDRQSVVLRVERGPAATVAGQRAGVVTSVPVVPGQMLAQGDVVARIDDVAVLALRAEMPPYRDLAVGVRGNDVSVVAAFLSEIGLLQDAHVSDVFSAQMKVSVGALQRLIGATQDGVFRPEYVAFVPVGWSTVSQVGVIPGDRIDIGDTLIEVGAEPTAVHVAPAAERQTLSGLSGSEVTVTAGDHEVTVPGLAIIGDPVLDVMALIEAGLRDGSITSTDEDGSAFSGAMARLATPESWGIVPTTALYGGPDGDLCLFIEDESGDEVRLAEAESARVRPRAVAEVRAATGDLGHTLVPVDIVGARAVRDPGLLTEEVLEKCA